MDKIPKKLHLYWDRSPMSWLQTVTIDTFHKHNPDWTINVYIPKQPYVGKHNYIPDYAGKDFFYRVENNPIINIMEVDLNQYGIKSDLHNILRSDILRYHLLYNQGGMWSDFDVIWLKPMDHLYKIAGLSDFNATICMFEGDALHHYCYHNISILVSAPKHPLYKCLINRCNDIQPYSLDGPSHQVYGTVMWNEMFPKASDILDKYPDVVKLDYATFFPYSIYKMDSLYHRIDLSVITDDVMCVHWFNGHKLSKEYVNNNGFDRDCSMTKLIEQIGEQYGKN